MTATLSFRDWLLQRIEDDTPVGDLARDATRDPDWEGDTPASLRQSMARHHACWAACVTLEDAARRWEVDDLLAVLDADD
ncbi:MAG TPA: hypothetical protein VD866_28115 [Urbifossiella sp.]|nr:hypothetical protein [Urbifossiella sp.]